MEERAQHRPSDSNAVAVVQVHDPAIVPTRPIFGAGTYVIQVPKDQIYRVPPPENASIVERHRKPDQNKRKGRYACLCCCSSIIVILIIIVALIVGLSFVIFKPKNPRFQVQRVVVTKSSISKNSRPRYNITLQVDNPNGRSSVMYKQDASASLSFKQQEIATGAFPTFYQDQKDSEEIALALKGTSPLLPKEIQNRMISSSRKSRTPLSFSLTMHVPVRMKTSVITNGNLELDVTCNFEVDTLAKGTRILSQECKTNR